MLLWLRVLVRLLAAAGAVQLIVGAFLPWGYAPIGRSRLPLPGILGPGGVTLLVGLVLLWRPRLHPMAGLVSAGAVAVWAPAFADDLAHAIRGTLIGAQLWIAPLNRLLEQFRINGIEIVDLALPRAAFLGPGVAVTAWGAGVAALAHLARLFLPGEGPPALQDRLIPIRCGACGVAVPRARQARFCPNCGTSLGGPPICPACRAPVATADRFCVTCGASISNGENRKSGDDPI